MISSTDSVFCFPDTNALIHFKTFTEVRWTDHLNAASVVLVLAPSVIDELDRHKDGSQEWRRGRARMLLSKINDLLDPLPAGKAATVSPGVSLDYITEKPRVDWDELGLDRFREDDRILATIKAFSDARPEERILLLSNDTGPKLKAKRLGIEALDPAKFLERLELKSEEEREMSRLRTELEKLRSRIPDLSVEFLSKGEMTQELILVQPRDRSRWIGRPAIETMVEAEREECLALVDVETKRALPDAWEDYQRDVDSHCADFETYLLNDRAYSSAWRSVLRFVIRNNGNANATGISATIEFPEETEFGNQGEWIKETETWSPPERPERPEPPKIPEPVRADDLIRAGSFEGSFEQFAAAVNPFYSPSIVDPSWLIPPSGTDSYIPPETRINGGRVHLEPMSIRAASTWEAKVVIANFPPPKGNRVVLPFHVHARECDKPKEGNLIIRFVEPED